MPIKMRPPETLGDRWKNRASAAAPDYQFGVSNPLNDWQANALAAKDAWRQGVTDAASRDAYGKGVAKTPTAFWQKRALELGVPRYPDGITKSVDVYLTNWKPYYDALTKIELPPRGARGDPKNLERVRVIVQTLRNVKTGGATK